MMIIQTNREMWTLNLSVPLLLPLTLQACVKILKPLGLLPLKLPCASDKWVTLLGKFLLIWSRTTFMEPFFLGPTVAMHGTIRKRTLMPSILIFTVLSGLLLERWLTLSCLWIGMLIVAASLLTQKLAGLNRCPPQQITPQVLLLLYEAFIRCLLRKYHRILRLAAWFRIWRRSTCWSRPPAWIWDLVLDAQVQSTDFSLGAGVYLSKGLVGSGLSLWTWFDPAVFDLLFCNSFPTNWLVRSS